ncbi:phosphate ABC transporter substrate-binding protein PstS [Streptomyces hoynatensis]|uniref:Phosphate-binding protein n=1 Tax=Streptomyces hoynatensis TaxID=1141874 RepID=A0A3A9Z117_9ACTN|nr:phosphate ABC transporter substrate-binding protein PstS [Streptomyces hoynatensis]RKN41729.1 phosphate ABC transporter substrate-binding protein PstS [Streptomyces hoynatensis]
MRNWRATTAAIATVSALALVTACSSSNEDDEPTNDGSSSSSSGASDLSGTISGVGSSAQQAAQQAWQAAFLADNPDVTINYDPAGSGAGREQFIAGGDVAFAGSDAYLDDTEITDATARCADGEVVELPVYVSPIAIVYNLPGVDELNLSPSTLAQIFDQKITNWNDEAIAADNPGVELPDTAITPVNRSDKSGTTENFTDYLAQTAPEDWQHEVSGDWPVSGGEGADGTSGVIQAVTNGEGAIGYADASQAGDLGTARIKVGDEYAAYSAEAAAAVLEVSQKAEGRGEYDFGYDLARDTTESGTYPIVLVSYVIGCTQYDDPATTELVKSYFGYLISEEGQQAAAEAAGSAPISDALRQQLQPAVDAIGAAS